jgi:hypothetical protein
MDIIEPGSLDLDQVHLRIGGIKTDKAVPLEEGNKFVVAEYFADPDGKSIDEARFDVSRMCYALFVSPEHPKNGRHKWVLGHHPSQPKTGRIVGGGLVKAAGNTGSIENYSGDFSAEPGPVRQKLAGLLQSEIARLLGQEGFSMTAELKSLSSINSYWLRYRQVLNEFTEFYNDIQLPHEVERLIRTYREMEEGYERYLASREQ